MTESRHHPPLFRADVLSDILHLAWPAIFEQILVLVGGFVVTIILGRYGTAELAAAGVVNMILMLLQTAFTGLATGSTVIIARLFGMGDEREARNTLFQSLIMGLGISVLVTGVSFLISKPLLSLFFQGLGTDVQNLAAVYFHYILICLPFLTIDLIIAASMRGAGDTFTPMAITGLGSIVHIGVALLLVGRLGMVGAGIALCTARILTSIIRLLMVFLRPHRLYLSFRESYRLNPALMGRIIRQGLPAFLEQAVMQGGFLMNNITLAFLGTAFVATWQVGTNINSLASMPIFGLAIAVTTCIGQALGAGRISDAADYARDSIRLGIVAISLIGILIGVFAEPLAYLFSSDPEVIRNSVLLIRFFSIMEPLLACINVSAGILRAGGDCVYVMLTSLIGLWLFRVGLSLLLVHFSDIGIYGIMIGTGCDFTARATLYMLRVRRGQWKYRKV